MGAKNCPETPRQKMISVMYLVLTAMLALNVDKSVLDAFYMVEEGLMTTIENFNSKNARVYADFEKAALENPEKAGELNEQVQSVKAATDSLYGYIDDLKDMLVKKADGPEGDVHNIDKKDDTHIAAEMMILKKNGSKLKAAIERYRDEMLGIVDEGDTAIINSVLKTLDTSAPPPIEGSSPSWEESKFQGYPLIAVITLMSKLQSDVRNTEADIINYLYAQIDAGAFKFNKLTAQIIPKSNYVLEGSNFEAKIFLSAIDTTDIPDIKVNNKFIPVISGENAGLYKVKATKEGYYTYKGMINYKNPEGQIVKYPFTGDYQVAKPSLTVSPTKMNVFYAGLANPVSISVPGLPTDQLRPSITNGRLVKEGRHYMVYPSKPGRESVITVKAEIDGQLKTIGSTEFRVKRVPDPVATVAGKNEGLITKNELLMEQGVFAEIPDFDFEMKFSVQSFVISTARGGFVVDKKANSNRFTPEQMQLLKGLNSGSRLYFENIVARGEDGSIRNLSAISFKIR